MRHIQSNGILLRTTVSFSSFGISDALMKPSKPSFSIVQFKSVLGAGMEFLITFYALLFLLLALLCKEKKIKMKYYYRKKKKERQRVRKKDRQKSYLKLQMTKELD